MASRKAKYLILLALLLVGLIVVSVLVKIRDEDSRGKRYAGPPPSYTTSFFLEETPIYEDGMWANGKLTGYDWADGKTAKGLASGTDSGTAGYADSTALLTGNWGTNQAAQATVRIPEPNNNQSVYQEVELRLRSSLSAHRSTGYEINFRCIKNNDAYAEIVRWNGALGKFTYLERGEGAKYGVADGDVVRATVVGDMVTAFINGQRVLSATDTRYDAGSPGMGFYLELRKGATRGGVCGFSRFAANDHAALTQSFNSSKAGVMPLQGGLAQVAVDTAGIFRHRRMFGAQDEY